VTTSTLVWGAVIVVVGLALFAMMPDPPSFAMVPTMLSGLNALAEAIAFAEGYGANADNAPTRANNPGSLKLPNTPVTGAEGISVFPTIDAGWSALSAQLLLIQNNQSHIYTPDTTIRGMAAKWTDTQGDAWTTNVVNYLNNHGYPGATPDTTLGAVLV